MKPKDLIGLPIEEIMETLSHNGLAVSILNDDNGHYAMSGDGYQNILTEADYDKTSCMEAGFIVESGGWKKTVREAVNFYLESSDCDISTPTAETKELE